MFWLVPVVCSLFLLLSAYSLLSALPVASYVFAAVGTIVLLSTPILTKICRIEMTKNRIVVYDLLGKVARDLPKEDIESIEILRGEDPCT